MKNVVVFAGNECTKEKEEYYYSLAYKTGKLLAENGFTVVSGGGPGLMDKLMQGAFENRGKTIAVCLEMKNRRHTEFATEKYIYKILSERQKKLISYGDAFISLPGGVGTLYEISEILALKRKEEIQVQMPFILLDSYFQKLIPFIENMVGNGFIGKNIYSYYSFVNTPEEAMEILNKYKDEI